MKKVSRSRLYDIRYVFQDLDRSIKQFKLYCYRQLHCNNEYNLFYCKCPKLKNIITRALIKKL